MTTHADHQIAETRRISRPGYGRRVVLVCTCGGQASSKAGSEGALRAFEKHADRAISKGK